MIASKRPRAPFALSDRLCQILKTLIRPREAVEKYFDAIMVELIQSMGSEQCRLRESACSAAADAVQGVAFERLEKYLEPVRDITFAPVTGKM